MENLKYDVQEEHEQDAHVGPYAEIYTIDKVLLECKNIQGW